MKNFVDFLKRLYGVLSSWWKNFVDLDVQRSHATRADSLGSVTIALMLTHSIFLLFCLITPQPSLYSMAWVAKMAILVGSGLTGFVLVGYRRAIIRGERQRVAYLERINKSLRGTVRSIANLIELAIKMACLGVAIAVAAKLIPGVADAVPALGEIANFVLSLVNEALEKILPYLKK